MGLHLRPQTSLWRGGQEEGVAMCVHSGVSAQATARPHSAAATGRYHCPGDLALRNGLSWKRISCLLLYLSYHAMILSTGYHTVDAHCCREAHAAVLGPVAGVQGEGQFAGPARWKSRWRHHRAHHHHSDSGAHGQDWWVPYLMTVPFVCSKVCTVLIEAFLLFITSFVVYIWNFWLSLCYCLLSGGGGGGPTHRLGCHSATCWSLFRTHIRLWGALL